MALPQLRTVVPATLRGNRSDPVSRDVIRSAQPAASGPGTTDMTTSARLEDVNRLQRLASQAAEALAGAPAEDVVRWAVDTFGKRICITSSMTDAVIVHLVSQVRPGVDVIFLDTGYHFAETIGTRDAGSRRSAARPAPAGWRPAPTPAAAGGRAPARPNAVFTADGRWRRARAGPVRAGPGRAGLGFVGSALVGPGPVSAGRAATARRRRARQHRSPGRGRRHRADGRGAGTCGAYRAGGPAGAGGLPRPRPAVGSRRARSSVRGGNRAQNASRGARPVPAARPPVPASPGPAHGRGGAVAAHRGVSQRHRSARGAPRGQQPPAPAADQLR